MRPLLLHGFGTSVRVNGRTLEIDWRSEGRKESFRAQQLPFDSVVVDSLTGLVSFEALRFLAIHDVPVTLLRWNGSVLSTILPRGPSNGDLRVAQVQAYSDPIRRIGIAREFIRAKVSKTVELAAELSRTLPVSPDPIRKEAAGSMGSTLNDLRIYEARVVQAHWKEYAKAVESLWPSPGSSPVAPPSDPGATQPLTRPTPSSTTATPSWSQRAARSSSPWGSSRKSGSSMRSRTPSSH